MKYFLPTLVHTHLAWLPAHLPTSLPACLLRLRTYLFLPAHLLHFLRDNYDYVPTCEHASLSARARKIGGQYGGAPSGCDGSGSVPGVSHGTSRTYGSDAGGERWEVESMDQDV